MIKEYQAFKERINLVIQQSGLNIGDVYWILKDTFRDVESLYNLQIKNELLADAEKIKEETEKQENAII